MSISMYTLTVGWSSMFEIPSIFFLIRSAICSISRLLTWWKLGNDNLNCVLLSTISVFARTVILPCRLRSGTNSFCHNNAACREADRAYTPLSRQPASGLSISIQTASIAAEVVRRNIGSHTNCNTAWPFTRRFGKRLGAQQVLWVGRRSSVQNQLCPCRYPWAYP